MESNQEKGLIAFEQIKKEVVEILGDKSENINPTFLILLLVVNFPLMKEMTKEEFYEKFCKIYDVIKNNKLINEVFELKSAN